MLSPLPRSLRALTTCLRTRRPAPQLRTFFYLISFRELPLCCLPRRLRALALALSSSLERCASHAAPSLGDVEWRQLPFKDMMMTIRVISQAQSFYPARRPHSAGPESGKGQGKPGPQLNPHAPVAKGKGKTKGAQGQRNPLPRFAVRVLPSEWDDDVTLTNLPALRKSLEASGTLSGNLIISRDAEVQQEIQDLLNAFAPPGPLAFGFPASESSINPSTAVWWTSPKDFAPPQRTKLEVVQMGDGVGPDLKPPTTVRIKADSNTPMVTVRISAPSCYRSLVTGPGATDDPAKVIAELAQVTGCKVSSLTGGHWQRTTQRQGQVLVGHIRVHGSLAEKLAQHSGHRGVMCLQLLSSVGRLEVAWLPREKGFTDEDYWMYAQSCSMRRQLPIAFRQGGGSDLGLAGADPAEFMERKPQVWCLYDSPKAWVPEDVLSFLDEQGWLQTEILHRRRGPKKGSNPTWVFKATRPEGHDDVVSFTYADVDRSITIAAREVKRKPANHSTEKIRAPKKIWEAGVASWRDETTDVDGADDDDQSVRSHPAVVAATPKAKAAPCVDLLEIESTRARSRSPPKKGPSKTSKPGKLALPDDLLLLQCPGWRILDNGGQGDCGFRSIAQGLAISAGKVLDEQALACEASRLRLLAVGHLNRHEESFATTWTQDPEELPEHRGHQPAPATFKEFTQLATRKDFWLEGMLAQALAIRLGTPLIIWSFCSRTNCWQRSVLAPWFEQGVAKAARKAAPAVSLVLMGGHYRTLCPPPDAKESHPVAWLQQTEERPRQYFRGAGRSSSEGALSIASGTPCRSAASSKASNVGRLSLPASTPKRPASDSALSSAPRAGRLRLLSSTPSCRKSCACSTGTANPGHSSQMFVPKGPVGSPGGPKPRSSSVSGPKASLSASAGRESCAGTSGKATARLDARVPAPKGPADGRRGSKSGACSTSGTGAVGSVGVPARGKKRKLEELSLPSATPQRRGRGSVGPQGLKALRSETVSSSSGVLRRKGEARSECDSVIGPVELKELDRIIAKAPDSSSKQLSRVWTCPLCQCRCETKEEGRKLSSLRSRHLASRHPDVDPRTVSNLRSTCTHTDTTPHVPLKLRAWTCAFCKHGLPYGLSRFALVTAAKRHYRRRHPGRDTSLKAIHTARAAMYRKDPSQQPRLQEGKQRLAKALKRKEGKLKDLAKGTGHKLALWEPHWASWPRRGRAKTKCRAGTLITCTKCHRIGNAGWQAGCVGVSGARTGAQRALWARLCKAGGPNLELLLKTWDTSKAQVDAQMYKSASMKKAEKHGHKVEWFTPHWASWKAKCSARLSKEKARFLTCTRCLRVAGGDWGRKCQGANATNKSKLRAHWKDTSPQNRKLLLRIWGLTKEQVNARLGLGKRGLSLALRNHKRKKLVFDGIERQPGPSSGCTNPDRTYTSLWTINCGGAKGAWQVVNHELSNGPPLMLLQETALSEHEARSYGAAAFKKGYHAYFSGCERTSRREHGGAMILAKTSLKLHRRGPLKTEGERRKPCGSTACW